MSPWMVPVAGAMMGLALLALGRRGRRVDDHPWCRRCRFDLFGLPSPTHCPECGAALSHQRAVRHGQRRRQPRVMLMGLLLLLGSIGYTGFAAWRITQAEDWIEHKPVWWLIRDLGSSDATIRDDSSDELNQRLWENALDADQIETIVERYLELKRLPGRTCPGDAGRFIYVARFRGQLRDPLWQRFVDASADVALRVRPVIRQGNSLPYEIEIVDYFTESLIAHDVQIVAAIIEGKPLDPTFGRVRRPVASLEKVASELPPGTYQFTATTKRVLFIDFEDNVEAFDEVTASFRIVDSQTPVVDLRNDPGVRQALTSALPVIRGANDWSLYFDLPDVSVPLYFKVFGDIDGERIELGMYPWAEGGGKILFGGPLQGLDQVDLVLVPASQYAEDTVDVFEIFGETIEYKNVPIVREQR